MILWCCGWRREWADDLPRKPFVLFLVIWPFAMSLSFGSWNGGVIWLVAACAGLLIWMDRSRRWTVLSAAIFIGSLTLFMTRMAALFPTMSLFDALAVMAIVDSMLTALLLRHASEHIVATGIGLLAAAGAAAWLATPSNGFNTLGISAYLSLWTFTFVGTRLLTWVLRMLQLGGHMLWRRGGHRY